MKQRVSEAVSEPDSGRSVNKTLEYILVDTGVAHVYGFDISQSRPEIADMSNPEVRHSGGNVEIVSRSAEDGRGV